MNLKKTILGVLGTLILCFPAFGKNVIFDNPDFISPGLPAKYPLAIIDSGVDYVHPILKDNIWLNASDLEDQNGHDGDRNGLSDDEHGWDFSQFDNRPYDTLIYPQILKQVMQDYTNYQIPDSENLIPFGAGGHGTHVTGIALEISKGVFQPKDKHKRSKGTVYLPLRVDCFADTYSQITNAIDYAHSKGAKVINISLGGYHNPMGNDGPIIHKLYKKMKDYGHILFVVAAGNDNIDMVNEGMPIVPGGFYLPNLLTVGAIREDEQLAGFTNIGQDMVEVYAPGVDIESTFPQQTFAKKSGTSMSAPFISGLAMRILEKNPHLYKQAAVNLKAHIMAFSRKVKVKFTKKMPFNTPKPIPLNTVKEVEIFVINYKDIMGL